MSIYGVICAGGTGLRMNGEKPKQFLELAGKPVIIYSIEKFLNSNYCDEILILVPQEWVAYTEDIIEQYIKNCTNENNQVKINILPGGDTRNETIVKAMQFVESAGKLDQETIFITHDAARPFPTERMIKESISKLKNADAVTVAVPVTDTVLISEDGNFTNEVPDRRKMFNIQTPQSFRPVEWKEKYDKLSDAEKKTLTDVTGLYVRENCKVKIIDGSDDNIKITYPKDLVIAEEIQTLLT